MDTTTLVQIDCFQGNTGEITINPTGGLAPFTFNWTGPNGFTSIKIQFLTSALEIIL